LGGVKTRKKIKNLHFAGRKIVVSESWLIPPPSSVISQVTPMGWGKRYLMSDRKGAYRVSVEKSDGKGPPVRPRRRWKDI